MFRLIGRRILSGLAVIFIASLLAFLILEEAPVDAVRLMLGDEASQEQIETVRLQLELDKPIYQRYIHYIMNFLQGDYGVSIVSGRPVFEMIWTRFFNTLLLTTVSILLAMIIGIGLGLWAAYNHNNRFDLIVLFLTAIILAIPTFLYAILLTQFFSVKMGWLPAVGGSTIAHLVLPCASLTIPITAVITRLIRAKMIEEIRKSYVVAAHAKGLSKSRVWLKHVLRNALIPAITVIGVQFGHLLGGSFIVETIFAWPGLGRLTVQAIYSQDFPVVLGAVILSASIFQVVNISVDLLHIYLDPRVL